MSCPTAPKPSPPSAPQSSADTGTKFGVYIHWPFCESKCPYCDFNSYARRTIGEEQFLEAALRELGHYAGLAGGGAVASVFFGGGTPSLMAASSVAALLDRIAALWPVAADCEITLEANPSSVEAGRFTGYRTAGVNRVSLGVQSLRDEQLRFLGRLHGVTEAKAALAVAARLFDRISFDLIYARPGQTVSGWTEELTEALSLAQDHLSLYQLTIEAGTAFFDLERRGKLRVPKAEAAAELYEVTQELCEARGLPAYEVSNHATPGAESRHNLIYWRCGDYAGIGPGAHGRLTIGGRRAATAAIRAPLRWHDQVARLGHGAEDEAVLTPREEAEEILLMGLRLGEGVSLERMAERTGFAPATDEVQALRGAGLLDDDGERLRTTRQGHLVLDAITGRLAATLTAVHRGKLSPAPLAMSASAL